MAKVEVKRGKGRPSALETAAQKHDALIAIRDVNVEKHPSRHLILKLIDMGYVAAEEIKNGRRGRNPMAYVLTGKGRGYVSLIERNMAKKAQA